MLWKNRFAYTKVAQMVREAAAAAAGSSAGVSGSAPAGEKIDPTTMLAQDNEKLHREMEQAQKALDDLHARFRTVTAQRAE
jgi:hypothetical protein